MLIKKGTEMDFNNLINKAIQKNEVIKLLRGEREYEIEVSKFTSDVFPTNINRVLVNCFYNQKEKIEDIDIIFKNALIELINGSAVDVYIAILYFDVCIFQEEMNKASFILEKETLAMEIQRSLKSKQDKLLDGIEFFNGMKKQNPWKNIENFNKYYSKIYGFSIV